MTDNIKSKHHRTEGIDIYEARYLIYPFEQYRAIMQSIAEHHMHMSDGNRVENLEEAIYILERLKEKEIEHDRYSHVKTNYGELIEKGNVATEWTPAPEDVLVQADFQALEEGLDNPKLFIRDIDASELLRNLKDDENIRLLNSFLDSDYNYLARDEDGELWSFRAKPKKEDDFWDAETDYRSTIIESDNFPEVQWSDEEPTKITDLLETYSKSEAPNAVKSKTAGQYLDEIYYHHDDLLKRLRSDDYDYLARDENGELWTHSYYPTKQGNKWRSISYVKRIYNDNFPEIQWTDDEPTKISELLAK